MMTLHTLAELLQVPLKITNVSFNGVSTDTRTLQQGELFVAIVGDAFDGHDFVDMAQQKKACAIVASRVVQTSLPVFLVPDTRKALAAIAAFHRAKFSLPVLALTGSCGKTTTKTMLASILTRMGPTLAPQSSFNNDIGVPLTLLRLDNSHHYAVIEMGANHPGEIAKLCELAKPDAALITNVGPAHLEGFGSIDGVAEAKGEIYRGLSANGIAIINADEKFIPMWRSFLTSQRTITFGLQNAADFMAKDIKVDAQGFPTFNLYSPTGKVAVRLPLMGEHNVINAVAAAAAAYSVGANLEAIVCGLENAKAESKRLNKYVTSQGAVIIDDSYNANPLSVKAALILLSQVSGEKIFVFGDMAELGDYAEEMHRQIGITAKELGIKKVFTCGTLSRWTAEAFGGDAHHFIDQSSLITTLMDAVKPNVTILIKGSRSSRMENVVKALI